MKVSNTVALCFPVLGLHPFVCSLNTPEPQKSLLCYSIIVTLYNIMQSNYFKVEILQSNIGI